MRLLIPIIALIVSACGTTTKLNSAVDRMREEEPLGLSPGVSVNVETAVVAGAMHHFDAPRLFGHAVLSSTQAAFFYIIYDPLAPNWEIKERAINQETFMLSLKAKSFRIGGDGEALMALKRRALYLQRVKGYSSYQILDYSEGIESTTPFTHRVSEGTIRLVKTP